MQTRQGKKRSVTRNTKHIFYITEISNQTTAIGLSSMYMGLKNVSAHLGYMTYNITEHIVVIN
jgi:hypothetical protein